MFRFWPCNVSSRVSVTTFSICKTAQAKYTGIEVMEMNFPVVFLGLLESQQVDGFLGQFWSGIKFFFYLIVYQFLK